MIPQTLKNYTKLDTLHNTDASRVYKLRDKESGEVCIVKVQTLEKGKKEFRLHHQAALLDEGVLPVHKHASEHTLSFLFLECGQRDLHQAMQKHNEAQQPWKVSRLLDIWTSLAGTLACLHANDIAHRDIKPANIVKAQGRYRLTDFGVAAIATHSGHSAVGTRSYMSPELLEAKAQYSLIEDPKKDDLWALGVTFIEMLLLRTKESAFPYIPPQGFLSAFQKSLTSERLPESVQTLLRKMLEPANSRITARELFTELVKIKRSYCVECEFAGENLDKTPCGHYYHRACLRNRIDHGLKRASHVRCMLCAESLMNDEDLLSKLSLRRRCRKKLQLLKARAEFATCPRCQQNTQKLRVNEGLAEYCVQCPYCSCEFLSTQGCAFVGTVALS